MSEGIEALADGTLLLTVLLVASGLVLATVPSDDRSTDGIRYAEDARLALFRTEMDGLGYAAGERFVRFPNATTVEEFLRIEVHLRAQGRGGFDFDAANARIEELATRLVRPGWGIAIVGGLVNGTALVHLAASMPPTHYDSPWTYPALGVGMPDTRLVVAVFPLAR